MKFFAVATTLLASAVSLVSAGVAGTVSWDSVYDSASTSTLSVACSDGVNGLYTKGYPTLGSLPRFPMVAAAPTIAGWNSPNCGKCFKVWYKAPTAAKGTTIYVIGVDTSRSSNGFVMSKAAMNALTGGQAEMLGRVDVMWEQQVSGANCGMP